MFEAPYLSKLDFSSPLSEAFFSAGLSEDWGIIIQTKTTDEKELLELLRSSLWANINNDELFFRYYDPRVARQWMCGLSEEARAAFFADLITDVVIPYDNCLKAVDRHGITQVCKFKR